MVMTFFDWDDAKAESNVRKHGVSFLEATGVFDDPWAHAEQDRDVDGELSWQTIGMVGGVVVLLVAHTSEEDGGDLWIRIISARQATRRERRRYEASREGSAR